MSFVAIAIIVLLMGSCNRSDVKPGAAATKNVPDYSGLTESQKTLAQVLRQTSFVLAAISTDPDVAYEIEWGVKTGYYSDESILLKELFFPEKSELYNNPKNKYPGKHVFAGKFAETFARGNYPHAEEFKDFSLPAARTANYAPPTDYLIQNGVQIYFPYSEEFGTTYPDYTQPWNQVTTTYEPINNEDANWGEKPVRNPVRDDRGPWIYESVWVDDDYAFANRTYILNTDPDPAPARIATCEPNCPMATIVKIGWVKSENQFGGIFKKGPKLRFVQAEGFIIPNATTTQPMFAEVGINLTRRDVRKRTWKAFDGVWDLNWSEAEKEHSMTVYEWDKKGSQKWTGSVKVSVGTVELNAGFEQNLQSQSSLVYVQQMPRTPFLAANVVDLGNGLRDNFTVYKSQGVYFTIPIQIVQ